MAQIYNEQRVIGIRVVPDGTTMYLGRPTIGIRDASGAMFGNFLRTIGVADLSADQAIYNDQPVLGAVAIYDNRTMYNGSLVLPAYAVSGAPFGPTALFLNNEPGAWYDPSDLSTLYQDAAGTVPVTAAGQTVGLVLDKSKGLVLGPELVTNGRFDSGAAGWNARAGCTLSVVDGWLRLTYTGTGAARANFTTLTTVVGRTYKVSFAVRNTASTTTAGFFAYSDAFATQIATSGAKTAAGSYEMVFTATTTTTNIEVGNSASNGGVGAYLEFDNISVRELPGNHATQTTTASKPILAREPLGGRRNLLTWTEQFDNAAWAKTNITVTSAAATSPDGTVDAQKIQATATAATSVITPTTTIAATSATFSIYVKQGTGSTTANTFTLRNMTAAANLIRGTLNYNTGVFTYLTGTTGVTVTNAGNGWWRLAMTATSGITSGDTIRGYVGFDGGSQTTGDHLFAWGAQLETGSTATAYQKVVSAADVTEAGKADLWYLLFDGTDDFLVTNTITPGTDKAQVFAGVRKLSDAARAILLETGAGGGSGSFRLEAPPGASANYAFVAGGTILTSTTTINSFAAPITNILTGLDDISGDSVVIRVNAVQTAPGTTDQGTGNFLAYPLYIGRRGGTSLPFNGRLYGLITRFGPTPDAATIAKVESWMNQRTGAY